MIAPLVRSLWRRLFDRDYSPAYQDEYQQLWHATTAALRESERDGEAVALQRDDLRARLDRIRAAAESDAELQEIPALRWFLTTETEPGVLHVPGVSGTARTALDRAAISHSHDGGEA